MYLPGHRRYRRALHAALDSELSPQRSLWLDRHLRRCRGCRGDLRTFERIRRSLRSVDAAQPPDMRATRLRRYASGVPS